MDPDDGPPIRVLVVDDDPNVRFTVRVALEGSPPPDGEPMAVQEAGDGKDALRALAEAPFDIVLLDITMPGPDGFAVLHEIRKDSDHLAVVILSGTGREADIANAYRAGADGYVTKPFEVDDLARLVRDIATADAAQRHARRAQEMQRAELLLQLEHGFRSGPDSRS